VPTSGGALLCLKVGLVVRRPLGFEERQSWHTAPPRLTNSTSHTVSRYVTFTPTTVDTFEVAAEAFPD